MIKGPFCASWEATLRCNLFCSHCGLCAGPRHAGLRGRELSTTEAQNMFCDLRKLGVSHLILSGGEFLTRPDAKKLLEYSLRMFVRVRLISNGMKSPLWMKSLPHSDKLTLSLSLDGSERMHDAIRNRSGSFQNVLNVLDDTELQVEKTVISTITRHNVGELDVLERIVKERGVRTWAIQIGLPAGRMRMQDFLGEENLKVLAQKIFDLQLKNKEWMEIIPDDCFGYASNMRKESPWQGCPAGKDLLCILSNGDVTGCPTLREVFGNVRDQSLEEIWRGEALSNFQKEVPECGVCNNSICFGGCKAVQALFKKQFCF